MASILVVVLSVWAVNRLVSGGGLKALLAPSCTVATTAGTFSLGLDQAGEASTIAAVGHRLGLPDHAVTVALAAAMQESKLINLPGGDRDSVGLFQQRPSEGWGTPAQLIDPVYAATAFYRALTKVPGWESLAVTVAAQDVQHSAAPDAYASHEPAARSLAIALTGEVPAAFTCHFTPPGTQATPAIPARWSAALAAELGSLHPGEVLSSTEGWALSSWLVAHAQRYGINSVSFAGRTWRARTGNWVPGAIDNGTVQVT